MRTLTGGEVAKLFAKHFKLPEQLAHIRKSRFSAACGTPDRVAKLMDADDGLSIAALRYIVLDASCVDAKQRTLIDQPETRDALFRSVLSRPDLLARLRSGATQLVLW